MNKALRTEHLGHYVYLLKDSRKNGKVFYVGKGKGKRILSHEKAVMRKKALKNLSNKNKKIQNILKSGKEIDYIILRHGMDKATAKEIESAAIDFAAHFDKAYLTNAVRGYDAFRGIKPLKAFYAKPAKFHRNKPVVLININKKYKKLLQETPPGKDVDADKLYAATRKAWRFNLKHVKKIKIACAVYRGIILAVFQVGKWYPVKQKKGEQRVAFTEEPVSSSRWKNYVGQSVKAYWKQGNRNPVQYAPSKPA
jgi:hypothetical protein